MAEVKKVRKRVSMKKLLTEKKVEVAEREKSLPRWEHQVNAQVWVWMIKYRRVAAFRRGYPLFLCPKKVENCTNVRRKGLIEPFLLDTTGDIL